MGVASSAPGVWRQTLGASITQTAFPGDRGNQNPSNRCLSRHLAVLKPLDPAAHGRFNWEKS